MHAANLVRGCPLFHEIFEEEINQVLDGCIIATFEKGDPIIKAGDTGTEIFVILEGQVDVSVNKNGEHFFITTLQKGDLFGELVLINETERTADVVCSEQANVLIISYEHFFSFFKKNPKLFSLMVLNVTRLMTKRLKNSNKIIEKLNHDIHEKSNKAA